MNLIYNFDILQILNILIYLYNQQPETRK